MAKNKTTLEDARREVDKTDWLRIYTDVKKGWKPIPTVAGLPSDREYFDGPEMAKTIDALNAFFGPNDFNGNPQTDLVDMILGITAGNWGRVIRLSSRVI